MPPRRFLCGVCLDLKVRLDEDAAERAGCPKDVCEGCHEESKRERAEEGA